MATIADTVFFGGHVAFSDSTALAVGSGRILALGSDADVKRFIRAETRVVDLANRWLVASLTDAHCHLFNYGKLLAGVDLRGCTSAAACAERVRAACSGDATQWLLGRGWDESAFEDKSTPTAALLDAACPTRPVWLIRVDAHAGWASTAAMRAAGVDSSAQAGALGAIGRDALGHLTGVFLDASVKLIEEHVPALTIARRKELILIAQQRIVALGLTSIHEMGVTPETEVAYRELDRDGALAIRVVGYADHGGLRRPLDKPAALAHLATQPDVPTADRLFTMQGVKLWSDGALGSRGAALLEDYSDRAGHRGFAMLPRDDLLELARAAMKNGWQLAVHAIGDRANREVLDAFETAGVEGRRFRIEHAQIIAKADLSRFAQLGVIASMQPYHATSDMRWAADRLGDARMEGAYAPHSLEHSGATVVFGSDFPVESANPWVGMNAAIARTNERGEPPGGWRAGESLTAREALRNYTSIGAYAAFQERFRGSPEVGYVADLTVIDRDPNGDASLVDTRVDLTMVGGRVVYQRPCVSGATDVVSCNPTPRP